jgi:hypothetical protein
VSLNLSAGRFLFNNNHQNQLKFSEMSEYVKIDGLTESLKQYVDTNIELIQLEVVERFSVIGASLISIVFVGITGVLFVLFISIGAGFYLSYLLGNYYSGFAIIAGFYLLLFLILIIGKKKLFEKPLRDKIIQKAISTDEV